ncbi:MAG: ATP-dependent RecD-like DNA helicase [Kiritimatiellaeota bacterium]|nr:ATP-dependent RecD-like DNA helicase [Kiritimatiellota bacterium]
MQTISTTVERVLYPRNGETGASHFVILSCGIGVCKGTMPWIPNAGEKLAMRGAWGEYQGNAEFRFKEIWHDLPADPRAMLRYACELTRGIGPQTEQAIWETCGEGWRDIGPGQVPKLHGKLLDTLRKTIGHLALEKEKSDAIAWLISAGCTRNLSEKAYGKWKASTASVVQANCYALADLPNHSFRDVDASVRLRFGITDHDPRRLSAAVMYFMGQLADGPTAVDWWALRDKVMQHTRVPLAVLTRHVADMFNRQELVAFHDSKKIALPRDFLNESAIWDFARHPQCPLPPKPFQPTLPLDPSQLAAVRHATAHRLSIVNGGAGCGKTTIIREIVQRLKRENVAVCLCAFAGKAAARLKEATGHHASTIHRLLDYKGESGFTLRTLKGSAVIIDEASMVSSDIMAEIVRRNPGRLILVGDEAQLPPVGAGQPFHDLIALQPSSVATLTTCYRNTEAIFKAAAAIRNGGIPCRHERTDGETWDVRATGDAEATHNAALRLVRNGEIDFSQDIILCCRNGEGDTQKASVESLNADIKATVNPSGEAIASGDRIICTKNLPDIDIWNGTTGTVKTIDHSGGVWITLDYPVIDWVRSTPENPRYVSEVLMKKEYRRHLQLAYALTVHKAQGSQYRKVLFVCLCRDQATLLDRPMAYTAVTRARKACVVIGEPRALHDAIRTLRHKSTVMQLLAHDPKP